MSLDDNPYSPPGADLGKEPPPERGPAFKAVLLGFLADLGITVVLSVAFFMAYGVYLVATGMPEEEVNKLISEPEDGSFLTITMLSIGGLGSAIGGYICARIARHAEMRLAAILVAVSLVLAWLVVGQDQSAPLVLMSSVITVIATLFGAWVGARRNRVR